MRPLGSYGCILRHENEMGKCTVYGDDMISEYFMTIARWLMVPWGHKCKRYSKSSLMNSIMKSTKSELLLRLSRVFR